MTIQSSAQENYSIDVVQQECCLALDHLRSALDAAKPGSVIERELSTGLIHVAAILDMTAGRR